MRLWRSFYNLLLLPLKIVFIGILFLGIGSILINPALNNLFVIRNENIILIAELMIKFGNVILLYAPFIFLLRTVNRKVNGGITIMSGFLGYISFLISTMVFSSKIFPSYIYSPIFNINFTSSLKSLSGVHYPLNTGLIGVIIVTFITRITYSRTKYRSQYALFSFIDNDLASIIKNIIFCALAGLLVSLLYIPFFDMFKSVISFISKDITNPITLFIYGFFDRFLSTLGLNNIIRFPFLFGSEGGSWASLVGESVSGDVNIWTTSFQAAAIQNGAGRFITPYYVLNIFAIPGIITGLYTIYTDKFERKKLLLFFILAILVSIFCGTLFPLEIMLLLLSPLLYLFHLLFSSFLFSLFALLKVYLGYYYVGSTSANLLPGTVLELVSYLKVPSLQNSIRIITIVGLISYFLYLFMTRFYFKRLAVDLFMTGKTDSIVEGILDSIGGSVNIKMINTTINKLSIKLFDPSLLDADALYALGASKISETKAGYSIDFGAASTILGRKLNESIRTAIRSK